MLMGMFGALAAGVVLGAKVPVVLAGRSDSMEVRTAACVLASLVARAGRVANVHEVHENTLVRAARAVA